MSTTMASSSAVGATKAECDQHISDIRKHHGADLDPRDTAFFREELESTLKVLSEQLYTIPSHFIYELIQNADDNTYPSDARPSALLAYRDDGFFFFGCNEVGFSRADVEAICRNGKSTKTLLNGEDGCIGEKGIGFKAVFKVANEVWISSGNYEFKFDKREPLGMITPSLEAFPKLPAARKMTTMIALKIEDPDHRKTILEQLNALMADSFMFLRRLKEVSIIEIRAKTMTESKIMYKESQLGELRCLEAWKKTSGARPTVSRFLVSTYTVTNMPETAQRPNMAKSSIKLAFPVDDKFAPQLGSRQVYAFLPVCLSGLPFHIHADFLLVASRQGVDESLAWNRHLRDQIVEAVFEAFASLRSTQLRFTWIMFLPKAGQCLLSFLGNLGSRLITRAREEKMLETCSGALEAPSRLFTVPKKYCDHEGTPLLLNRACRYVAQQYPASHVSALVPIALDPERFVRELEIYLNKQPEDFKNKANAWHSRLCSVLGEDIALYDIRVNDLWYLPLIPLAGDRWIAARSGQKKRPRTTDATPFYLPDVDSGVVLPEGLHLFTVDGAAARDLPRSTLYRHLGGQRIDYDPICAEILKLHKDPKAWKNLSTPVAISHARFLFSMPPNRKPQGLYGALLVTDHMQRLCKSSEVYMDKPGSAQPVSEVLLGSSAHARFLHPEYLEVFGEVPTRQTEWLGWLELTLGVNTIPRLTNDDNTGLSAEFSWIIQNCSSRDWLLRLKDSWKVYRLDTLPGLSGTPQAPSASVRKQIRDMMVDCTDGNSARLNETVLPTLKEDDTAISTAAGLRYLDLKDEENKDWFKLSTFGVTSSMDINFHIKILQRLQQKDFVFPVVHGSKDSGAAMLYKRIQDGITSGYISHKDDVHNAFLKAPLVYIPQSASGQWRDLKDCVWADPGCFHELLPLEPIYPNLSLLFKSVLQVQNVTTAYMVHSLAEHQGKVSKIGLIKDILRALSNKIMDRKDLPKVRELAGQNIFPVIDLGGSVKLVSNSILDWFIPDTPSLKTAFLGKVKLLDFSRTDQDQLRPLLEQLNVDMRMLSLHAEVRQTVVGLETAVRNKAYTMKYRDRAHYLLCLRDALEDAGLKTQLDGIEVYAVISIITRRHVHDLRGRMIVGADEEGSIVIESGPGLKIYAPQNALEDRAIDVLELAKKICEKCKFTKDHLPVVQNILTYSSTIASIETSLEDLSVNFEKRAPAKSSHGTFGDDAGGSTASRLVSTTPQSDLQASSTSAERQQARLTHSRSGTWEPSPNRGRGGRGGLGRAGRTSASNQTRSSMRDTSYSSDEDSPTQVRSTRALADGALNSIRADARSNRPIGTSTRGSQSTATSTRSYSDTMSNHKSNGAGDIDVEQAIRIGAQGELKMHELLRSIMGTDYNKEMWTSHTRDDYTDSAFLMDDSKFADFTIHDKTRKFTKWLATRDEQAKSWLSPECSAVKYHLEVKSTYGPAGEAFHMSQNQIEMAQRLQVKGASDPIDVYVVMRVSDLAGSDGVAHVYPIVDPWAMIETGTLLSFAPGGYVVSFA